MASGNAISGIGPCLRLLQLSTDAEDLNTPPNNIGFKVNWVLQGSSAICGRHLRPLFFVLPLNSFDWVQRCRIQAKHSLSTKMPSKTYSFVSWSYEWFHFSSIPSHQSHFPRFFQHLPQSNSPDKIWTVLKESISFRLPIMNMRSFHKAQPQLHFKVRIVYFLNKSSALAYCPTCQLLYHLGFSLQWALFRLRMASFQQCHLWV